jgi:hypothetical protein
MLTASQQQGYCIMRIVEKGWGREEIWAAEPGYCGKNMVFEEGKRFSTKLMIK